MAAADAAYNEGIAFRGSRSGTVNRDEEEEAEAVDPDLGLDPADAEGQAWWDQNRAVAELEAASIQAWVNAVSMWARTGEVLGWPEMPAGTVTAATVFVPASGGDRG